MTTTEQQKDLTHIGPEENVQQITTFVDDTVIETYDKPHMSSVSAWTKMAEDDHMHDIHSILQRPVRVHTGEFNSSFTNVKLKFPDIIFQASKNVVKKLDYFLYFRANVKIRLVFNATPFMSGKYWMFFAPFDAVSNRKALLDNLCNVTGYPGIEIDMGSNAPVEIKIPYCSPLSHYNLVDTHSNMGELYIVPLNYIQSGTSPLSHGATFTIFAWFEDVEVAMPTSRPVSIPAINPQLEWKAQMGKSEDAAATSGPPISGVANAVANVASTLSGIPLLSSWVRPVEWVARAVGGVASAFGWSKPTNLDKNTPFINVPAKGYTNVEGIDLSSKLAAMPDNGLTYDAGIFSTDLDEMDISYVTSKSCIYKAGIDWNTGQEEGKILHYFPVAPGVSDVDGAMTTHHRPTTLAFVASMFQQWRGGLKYRLTVAKTAFHTGRLRITYHPGIHEPISPAEAFENAYNWILDLSVSSELEFEIPYISNVPWKEVSIGTHNSAYFFNERYSTGTVSITVLNELRIASDSVASNCPINMWISGASDLSFAMPDFGKFMVTVPTQPPPKLKRPTHLDVGAGIDEVNTQWKAQILNLTSGAIQHNEQVTDAANNLFPMSKMGKTTAEELTIGEKITSLRQLVKRFALTAHGYPYPYKSKTDSRYVYPGPVPNTTPQYLFNKIVLDPAYFGEASEDPHETIQTVKLPIMRKEQGELVDADFDAMCTFPARCPLYYISYLYRFWRGSRRYKIATPCTNGLRSTNVGHRDLDNTATTRKLYTSATDGVEFDAIRPSDPLIVRRSTDIDENGTLEKPHISSFQSFQDSPVFEHYVYPDLNGTIEFEVPFYSQTPISLVGEKDISDVDGPVIRRSKIAVTRSLDPEGMDRPVYSYPGDGAFPTAPKTTSKDSGAIRNCFGAFNLYEAAGDDFSFGYLVGAPEIRRIISSF
jgi:hypothetical protein